MEPDLTLDLIHATVQIEQPAAAEKRTVGTGFLIDDPTPDGRPRTVLITAAHVFELMTGDEAKIGWRTQAADGSWHYDPQTVRIRDHGRPLWVQNPDQDVAALSLKAPPEFAKAAIPLNWLADERTFAEWNIGPGDEMMTLGFPNGLSSNAAGFPILRSGRVASYPLSPVKEFPTFLIDLHVLPGNSGGPVFMADYGQRRVGTEQSSPPVISGVMTKEIDAEIGVVVHAVYIRETVKMLDRAVGAKEPAKVPTG